MTNFDFKKLVNKYAIILIISYGLTFLLGILLQGMFPGTSGQQEEMSLIMKNIPLIFQFFINIVISLIIIEDSKKLEIKNNLIIVAAILFSLVGVCMFLLLANREKEKANA
jgi:hypothetical protein